MGRGNLERVERLLSLLERSDASEIEVEAEGWRLRARRQVMVVVAESETPPDEQTPVPSEPVSVWIRAPLVGFFQARSKPIQVGDAVSQGEVVCVIKAMGLLNEVRSPVDGRVTEILVEDGVAVEYGQPLYRIVEENANAPHS
jgi:acetyl-CoA carboxylase biotin carboxyl carrier protein